MDFEIDHVEIFVPDREAALSWYHRVFEFEIVQPFLDWADFGPLMISGRTGQQMIALFVGVPQGDERVIGLRRLAFRLSGPEFVEFVEQADKRLGREFTKEEIVDHQRAYSVYFSDPFGNPLEVTTYDYDLVHSHVSRLADGNGGIFRD